MTNIPIIQFFEWDIEELSTPIGRRHIAGGIGFKQIVASGCQTADPNNTATTSGTLVFQGTKFDIVNGVLVSEQASKVAALTIHLDTSGVAIGNMKMFLRDDSALRASVDQGLDPAFVQMGASGTWNPTLTLASGAAPRLSTTIPSFPNIKRQDGAASLEGTNDFESSEFIYMNVVIPFGTPLGSFGVCGSGALRFGLSFDYFPV
jgi:hypothetical protein